MSQRQQGPLCRRPSSRSTFRFGSLCRALHRPLCAGRNYAQMRNVRVSWPRTCAACARSWPIRPGHSFRAHEVSRRSAMSMSCCRSRQQFSTFRGGNCDRLARTPAFVGPADRSRLMSNRATNSATASNPKSTVAGAGRHEGAWCRKLCREVATPSEPSDHEDLCDDDSDLHIVATCA